MTSQVLLPSQVALLWLPSVSVHVLLPVHPTVLPAPVSSAHMLPPAHVVVQFVPHEPVHVDCPSQAVVQPLAQFVVHVFLDWQLKDALLGCPASAPLPFPPRAHVAPDWQSQVV